MGWTIRHDGTVYDIVAGDDKRASRLLADGDEVDTQTAGYWESSTLTHDETTIKVSWGPRNQITDAVLIGPGDTRTPLTPPPGSRAAAREAFQREHPTLYVLRRTAVAGVEIVIGILGVGALLGVFLGSLLPRLDLSWIPTPSAPDWFRYLDIGYWLGRLGLSWPDIDIPDWIQAALEHKKYWLPVLIALLVALGELERRKKIDAARESERDQSDDERD